MRLQDRLCKGFWSKKRLTKELGLLNDLARELAKCRQWIERQRLRIEDLEHDGHDATAAVALLSTALQKNLTLHQDYRQRVATRLEQDRSRGIV
jgi:hypothetical protein